MNEYPGNGAEWEKAVIKGYIMYDSMYVTFLKSENFRNGGQIGGCRGWEGGRRSCKAAM